MTKNITLESRMDWGSSNPSVGLCQFQNYHNPVCGCDMTPSYPQPYYPTYPEVKDYYIKTYYPIVQYERSKVDEAFRIIKALQEKGYMKIKTVEDFTRAVDVIAGVM